MNGLFDRVDKSGDGTLDLNEIRKALETWKSATTDEEKNVIIQKKATTEAWKNAKLAQVSYKKQMQADADAARAREEEEALQKAGRIKAAKEAAEKKKEQALAAKKKKEEDDKAYEERIKQLRAEKAAQGVV